ncbi:MAG TPA: 4-hydroxy-3-methylbut-2-enyl diphosphate reductase [Tenuifilaceae bacterium]|nr:4-hydroxy-3-methylbut-2-enyl diphosphate reductase [Tenuifilaceae bacterium]
MVIEIDSRSGFCFGVVNAISQAESELAKNRTLYCLGDIVHNSEEVRRLSERGLVTISHGDLKRLKGKKVLFRAHGEPPETYEEAVRQGITIIDASCPVVLRLQKKIKEGWERMQAVGGQIVIYGKRGHAEVIGLVGQIGGNAIVIESLGEIEKIDFTKPIEIFAQTTMNADDYQIITDAIQNRLKQNSDGRFPHLKSHKSICNQVSNRKTEIIKFAARHSLILFVSGKNSSNGRMLFEACQSVNPHSHFISSTAEIDPAWFNGVESVGICGATSTPRWLMEEVADSIKDMAL